MLLCAVGYRGMISSTHLIHLNMVCHGHNMLVQPITCTCNMQITNPDNLSIFLYVLTPEGDIRRVLGNQVLGASFVSFLVVAIRPVPDE